MGRFLLGALLLVSCGDDDADPPSDVGEDVRDVSFENPFDVGRDAPEVDALGEDVRVDAGPPSLAATVYVTVGRENRLAVVRVDADGMLTEREDLRLALPGSPGAMTRDAASGRLYVGLDEGIATVDVDAAGMPTLAGVTTGTGTPVDLALANDGRTLVSAYYGDDRLLAHDVTGAPPHDESGRVSTPDKPHAVVMLDSRVYVPQLGAAEVRWTEVGSDGTFGASMSAMTGAEDGPRHLAFARGATLAYVVNEFSDSLTLFTVVDGSLTRGTSASTLPTDFDGDANTCADVHVHPSGTVAYASNRGHDSIAVFDLAADGTPTLRTNVPSEATPREFDLSPDGRLLVVAGQASGFLASYAISDDGGLEAVDRVELGGGLLWAIIVPD